MLSVGAGPLFSVPVRRVLRELGPHPDDGAPVWPKTDHYGPFVAYRRLYASVPKDIPADALTLERASALLAEVTGRAPRPAAPCGSRPRAR